MNTLLIIFAFLISFAIQTHSLPLSTKSRWIVDQTTQERVKLRCANWAAHLDPMLPEGLADKPLSEIARHISLMGFNCVRLTWATNMYTRHANLTVAQSFTNLGLHDSISGLTRHNPQLLSLTVVDAQKAVIEELGAHGVMVVLDNQVSLPMWCCQNNDGNGFFGDKYFPPREWLWGLSIVAHRYKHTPTVIGMSLRNELRGPLQNETVWYKYMEEGARAVNRANPNVLIIVSGLDYDLDFQCLNEKPLNLNLNNKLVYETHRYSFTEGQNSLWLNQPLNKVCDNVTDEINRKSVFLTKGENPTPMFVSEFGINQMGVNQGDNLFLACFLSYLAENDFDWSVWALQGNYYLREGLQGTEETYGMLDSDWRTLRNPEYHGKLQLLRQKVQEPNSKGSQYYIMYHPQSGKCARVDKEEVYTSDCRSYNKWSYKGNGSPIRLIGTSYCLSKVGEGLPVALTTNCKSEQSEWKMASNYQLANDGLCLDFNSNYTSTILTNKCIGIEDNVGDGKKSYDNPQSQWFKLVKANV